MHIVKLAALAIAALAVAGPTSVSADSYWDVEAARANARAGGPVSAYDAELLERYGCLSGTRSRFCQELNHRSGERRHYKERRRYAR